MRRIQDSLLAASIVLLISGCSLPPCVVPIRAPNLVVNKPPVVDGEGCLITVIRAHQFVGSLSIGYPIYYIRLDRLNVAELRTGEYTRFLIKEGPHTIGVEWSIGYLHLFELYNYWYKDYGYYHKDVEVECRPGEKLTYGTKSSLFRNEADGVELRNLTDLDEEFRLENKTFVPTGTPGECIFWEVAR